MERYFDIYLNAGNSVPVVINANQYDASETWIFTLYTDDNQQYTPASGSIVGLKSDGNTIANAGTVNGDGQVVIAETEQMTACAGINIFELILNGNHGTANFVVLVEPRPGDNATPSESDLSLMQEAISAAAGIQTVSALTDTVNSLKAEMTEFIADHAGLSNETVLWTGEMFKPWQSSATTPTGAKAVLSSKATNYDYIGVYTTMTQFGDADYTPDVHWFNADEFALKLTTITCGAEKIVSGNGTIAVPYITLMVDEDEVTVTVFEAGLVSWDGQSSSNSTVQYSADSNNYQGSIVKIVGIKNEQSDSEVINARVGADGTSYSTLKARLDAENSELKSAIAQLEAIPHEVKTAMDAMFLNMAVANNTVYSDEYATIHAWATATNLLSISAVFAQGTNVVYDTDSLDSLKPYLTVRANYDDGTSATVTSYTLSGILSEGTSTITVSYEGKTATFNVTVTGTIHLANGSFTFADGSTVTVNNNHVTIYLATYRAERFINLAALSDNTSDIFSNNNVNNKSTSFIPLSAGDKLTLRVYNATTDNKSWGSQGGSYEIAFNMRKQNTSTAIYSPALSLTPTAYAPNHEEVSEGEVTTTLAEATVAANVFAFIAMRYPANTTFECDIRIVKE